LVVVVAAMVRAWRFLFLQDERRLWSGKILARVVEFFRIMARLVKVVKIMAPAGELKTFRAV